MAASDWSFPDWRPTTVYASVLRTHARTDGYLGLVRLKSTHFVLCVYVGTWYVPVCLAQVRVHIVMQVRVRTLSQQMPNREYYSISTSHGR